MLVVCISIYTLESVELLSLSKKQRVNFLLAELILFEKLILNPFQHSLVFCSSKLGPMTWFGNILNV